jgi:hypothetical protein
MISEKEYLAVALSPQKQLCFYKKQVKWRNILTIALLYFLIQAY